jgi:hypothetical protein
MPTIVLLKCFCATANQLEIFPASHRPGQVLQECREIGSSLREFPKAYCYQPERECHLTFNLFGIREENMYLLAEVMEGIVVSFPDTPFTGVEISIDDIAIRARSLRLAIFTHLLISSNSHGATPDSLMLCHASEL